MRQLINLCTLISLAVLFTPFCSAGQRKPVWRIDLHVHESGKLGKWIRVKFSGRFLAIYPGDNPRLVFDTETHQRVPEERLAGTLPPPEPLQFTWDRQPFPAINVIARWKGMAIEQVGGIGDPGIRKGETKFYLREPGGERILLFRGPERCNPYDPAFVGDDYIMIFLCSGQNAVVNKQGKKVYELPTLAEPYVVPDLEGARFAVYERAQSFFSALKGETDRLRVKVFRSSDGRKLFEYRWHAGDEATNDGRIALSDDGSLVAIAREAEVLVFAVREEK